MDLNLRLLMKKINLHFNLPLFRASKHTKAFSKKVINTCKKQKTEEYENKQQHKNDFDTNDEKFHHVFDDADRLADASNGCSQASCALS